MKHPAIPPWSPVATDSDATKLIKVWRDGLKVKAPELPTFVNQDRVRLTPRNPVHPAIVWGWYRL